MFVNIYTVQRGLGAALTNHGAADQRKTRQ
jgi:hypothetical protein